jgi:hypothetical protein
VTLDKSMAKSVEFYHRRFAHTDWQVFVCDTLQQAQAWRPDNDGNVDLLLGRLAEPFGSS